MSADTHSMPGVHFELLNLLLRFRFCTPNSLTQSMVEKMSGHPQEPQKISSERIISDPFMNIFSNTENSYGSLKRKEWLSKPRSF